MDDSHSRELLETFLKEEGIRFSWLKESDKKSADLELWLEGQKIIGELKTIIGEEKDGYEERPVKGTEHTIIIQGGCLGSAIRGKIRDAEKQLKPSCGNKFSGILFLMGGDRAGSSYLRLDHVIAALEGIPTVTIHDYPDNKVVSEGRKGASELIKKSALSAIAICYCCYNGKTSNGKAEKISKCHIFRNKHASIPIKTNFSDSGEWHVIDWTSC